MRLPCNTKSCLKGIEEWGAGSRERGLVRGSSRICTKIPNRQFKCSTAYSISQIDEVCSCI
ncbi:unknown protein [Microcystis aeruginosa NIES-843]|uniref:Uncharacterized protein n=1 Tax=Microcystis aeruginosa (strain NIES-843 / IAM M-2473) TaxID=449447 RepID=B0JR99_MICAN|nr:unknown protein [Microcystis aeruginosa NIES-843]